MSTMKIDESFHNIEVMTPTAFTPLGLEVLFDNECDEPTRVYPPGTLATLLRDASPHHHVTVPHLVMNNAIKRALRSAP